MKYEREGFNICRYLVANIKIKNSLNSAVKFFLFYNQFSLARIQLT